MTEVDDSVRRFRAALGTAVSRGRRARAEAHERADGFRRRTTELADRVRRGELRPSGPEHSDASEFRVRAGLPVEESSSRGLGPNAPDDADFRSHSNAEESQQQTPSDGSDLDFSQARIMR